MVVVVVTISSGVRLETRGPRRGRGAGPPPYPSGFRNKLGVGKTTVSKKYL